MAKKQRISLITAATRLSHYLGVRTAVAKHYDPASDGIYYHFAQAGEAVILRELNRRSKSLQEPKY